MSISKNLNIKYKSPTLTLAQGEGINGIEVFEDARLKIAIVIPCYKVANHIEEVISNIPEFISNIITVNDCSPDNTGEILENAAKSNSRLIYLKHEINQGVGGAMVTGFKKAIEMEIDIVIKIDGDGQMDLNYLPQFIKPLQNNIADFTKGNRFKNYKTLKSMPLVRRVGNLGLSFLTKAASGYWNIFDPANGYLAIKTEKLKDFDFNNLHKRYFFESSLLIEAYNYETVIKDIPIDALYGNEVSNLSVTKVLFEFPPKLLRAFLKRIILRYFLNDFNIASVYLIFGFPIMTFGIFYGAINFAYFTSIHSVAPTGTVVIPSLLITVGFQLLISFINFDVSNYPKR